MGDPIVSTDFIDLGTITSRSEDYADDNVKNYWHLKRRFRASDTTKNNWLLKFNFGSTQSAVAVVLYDVNFDKVQIEGHGSDAWGTPDYDSGVIEVSQNIFTGRYQVYIPLTSFNYQWMRIFIPSTAAAVGDYTTKWEVGAVVVLDSVDTIEKYGYIRTAVQEFEDKPLPHGGFERISLGDELRWEGTIEIPRKVEDDETQYWTFNRYDISTPMIFYENRGSTQNAYLCIRDDAYEGTMEYNGVVIGNLIHMKELI